MKMYKIYFQLSGILAFCLLLGVGQLAAQNTKPPVKPEKEIQKDTSKITKTDRNKPTSTERKKEQDGVRNKEQDGVRNKEQDGVRDKEQDGVRNKEQDGIRNKVQDTVRNKVPDGVRDKTPNNERGMQTAAAAKTRNEAKRAEVQKTVSEAESTVREAKEKIARSKTALEEKRRKKQISEADYNKERQKITTAEEKLRDLEESTKEARMKSGGQ